MIEVLQFTAILASTLFAGAAIYINFVEHPARLGCGTQLAATVWQPSYHRATRMQAPLALVAMLAALAVWGLTSGAAWLIGALLIGAVIPVTLLVIFPTNRRLLDPARDKSSAETRALLVTWGRLHAIRSVLSLAAALLFLSQVVPLHAPSATFDEPQFRALMQRLADGWNEGDARKAADCFTEDAVYTEPPAKQEYRGREKLYEFFGGAQGRKGAMHMVWHHLAFDAQRQVGLGEFTFEYGSKAHGTVAVQIRDGRIARWREYYYESDLGWDDFTAKNPF